ncbi:MAG: hypothetical protein WCI05_10700 [Myxococcales bacterium]
MWYISRTGTQEGPFQESQLFELIRTRALVGAFVREEKAAEWTLIRQHPTFAAACAEVEDPGPSANGPAPLRALPYDAAVPVPLVQVAKPGSSRSLKKLAIAGAALVLASAVAVGGILTYRHLTKVPLLPFEANRIPSAVKEVSRLSRDMGFDGRALHREEYAWVQLGVFCTMNERFLGPLFGSIGEELDESHRERLAQGFGPDLTRSQLALRCGRDLYRKWGSSTSPWFRIYNVFVLPISDSALPSVDPPFEKRSFRGFEGGCLPEMKRDASGKEVSDKCTDSSHGLAMLPNQWVFGHVGQLDELLRSYDKPTDEPSRFAEVLMALEPQMQDYNVVSASAEVDVDICRGTLEMTKEACPKGRAKKLSEFLASRIRGWGVGSVVTTGSQGPRTRHAFVAKDEDNAKAIQTELQDFRKEWKAHLDNQTDAIWKARREEIKGKKDEEREYLEAQMELMLRGIAKARVSRSGAVVLFDREPEVKESEAKAISRYWQSRKERSDLVARIIRTMASGREPETADLKALGGDPLLAAIERLKNAATPK